MDVEVSDDRKQETICMAQKYSPVYNTTDPGNAGGF
jgi:hypothetical protein